jgi:hypothetical protein
MLVPHLEWGQAGNIRRLDVVLDHLLHHHCEVRQIPGRLAAAQRVASVTAQEARTWRKGFDPVVHPASDKVAEPQAATHKNYDFLA